MTAFFATVRKIAFTGRVERSCGAWLGLAETRVTGRVENQRELAPPRAVLARFAREERGENRSKHRDTGCFGSWAGLAPPDSAIK